MSLLNKNKAFSVRDYLFIAAGLLGLFWFFLTYSSNDPRSVMHMSLNEQSAGTKGVQTLTKLGYDTDNFDWKAIFRTNRQLLDSLQFDLGRRQMIEQLSGSTHSGIYPYYWEIRFSGTANNSANSNDPDEHIGVKVNNRGELIGLSNPAEILPLSLVNRKALIEAFETDSTLEMWTSLPDTAWDGVLRFNLNRDYSIQDSMLNEEDSPHQFNRSDIRRLGTYYLNKGGWDTNKFKLDDIQIRTAQSKTAAEISFLTKQPILGQAVNVEVTVLPTGALLNLNATYNGVMDRPGFAYRDIMRLIRTALILLFGLATLIIFYFRIRSRAIDTNPALVVSVVAGLIIPAVIFLEEVQRLSLFDGGAETNNLVGLALSMGFSGAFATIGFFVVFSVGDSLMRQYWPDRLLGYDYLRQGMFFNRPLGETLIRAEILAFLMCGIWTTLLYWFPHLHFEIDRGFIQYESAWPPIFVFLNSAWFNILFVLGIFAVLGTQMYGSGKRFWLAVSAMIVSVTVIGPVLQGFGPISQELTLFLIIGAVLTFIFVQWDFLTTLITHFIFICFLEVSSGWTIQGSPDLYVFITFCGLLLLATITGFLAIAKGKERQALPNFVPDYVKELAQEQRIKQELQIAREVQQSFLPVQTPKYEYLELAGVCKPAYETGGDYYDFVRLDEHRVAVTIGDVSGKGIQAAFYMTFIKGILHSLCREIDSPAEVLKKTNRLFCENAQRGTFISLVYGIIDLKKQTFRFARAGHNPIIRINNTTDEIEELQPKGIGLGLTASQSFDNNIEEIELELYKDDVLILYTDGIVEALNENHIFYGTHRLNNLLVTNKAKTAAEILQTTSHDVRSFIGEAKQHDDMTMVVMKLKNNRDPV